jgi:hypothetical protein
LCSNYVLSKPNDYKPYISPYLGDFTDEIDQKNGRMKTCCTAGAKYYSYENTTVFKKTIVKGITLNNVTVSKINFDSIVNIVTKKRNLQIEIKQLKFSRNKIE